MTRKNYIIHSAIKSRLIQTDMKLLVYAFSVGENQSVVIDD